MSFFTDLIKRFYPQGTTKVVVQDRYQYIAEKQLNLTKFNLSKAELNSTVYTCINIISNTVSKFPIYVMKYENGRKVRYTSHPWYNSLRYNPFRSMNNQKFVSHGLTNMYLTGNQFYYKDENGVKPQLIPLGLPKAYADDANECWYKFEGSNTWLPAKDLVHFYQLSKDGKIGLNPIESIATELNALKYGEEGTKAAYEQGFFGTLYLESNVEAGAIKADLIKQRQWFDQLQEDTLGYKNAGKILKIDPFFTLKSIPPTQIDFLSNNKYSISQIGSMFGVPESLLGVQNSQTYGKADAAIEFFNSTLSNITAMMLAELSQKVLTEQERNEGIFLEMDYSSLYDVNLVQKAQYVTQLAQQGVYSPNELRQIFNAEPIENEHMNGHFVQSQNQKIEDYDKWQNNNIGSPIKAAA